MNQRNITQIVFVMTLTISMFLAGCTSEEKEFTPTSVAEPSEVSPSVTELPAPQQTVVQIGPDSINLIYTREFDNLNPLYSNVQSNDLWFSAITLQIWNAWAWDFDEKNNPQPVLVKEIPSLENGGLSEDGRVITMRLREGLVWSDGQPLTSEDFLFTYQMAINPNNQVYKRSPYDQIQSVTAPDGNTVVITFDQPYIAWLGELWHGILPVHILQPEFDAQGTLDNSSWNRAPSVGCGPFKFQEWQTGQYVRFIANEHYWQGRPKAKEVVIRFVEDDIAQINALTSGLGDLGTRISYTDIPGLTEAGFAIEKVYSGYNEGWFFYLHPEFGHPSLQDIRVRQAIALGLDRNSMIQDILLGQTQTAISYWDNTPYLDPTLQPWLYDPDQARQLLDDAGWIDSDGDGIREKDDMTLSFIYGTTSKPHRMDAMTFAVNQFKDLGIKLEPQTYDVATFFAGISEGGPVASGQLDIFQYAPTTSLLDPYTVDFLCSEIPTADSPGGQNWTGLCDEELDGLFELSLSQFDFAQRQEIFHQISRKIFENVYFLGLWQDPDLWAVNTTLTKVRLSGPTPFFNIHQWEVSR